MKKKIPEPKFKPGDVVVRTLDGVTQARRITETIPPKWNGYTWMYSFVGDVTRCGEDNLTLEARVVGDLEVADVSVKTTSDVPTLSQDKGETAKDFATRLLCSMFQEVYSHTGREMPEEMFDRASDLVNALMDTVREEGRNGYMSRMTW